MDGNGKVDLQMEEILQVSFEWVVLLGGMEKESSYHLYLH